jgi:hypothetical protein
MPSTLRVFSHSARFLAFLDSPTTPRNWILNGYGKAEFTIGLSYLHDKFFPREETMLQYGNLVYIEHIPSKNADGSTNGKLPAWVGMILPDRTWDFGMVHVTAYSAEAILTFRPMPLEPINGTPAQMFRQILDYANVPAIAGIGQDVVIHPGVIEDISQTFSDSLATSAYDHIVKLCQRAGMNWDVTGVVDSRGVLQLYANLYRFKGNRTGLVLTSNNTELSGNLLTEQGTPYNVILGYSQASTKESRYFALGINQASVDKFGALATNQIFSGVTDQAGLANAAQSRANNTPPFKKFRRVAVDVGKTFDSIAAGNVATVIDTNVGFKPGGGYGFEANARILSVDYNDLVDGKCPLNLEVF